MKGKKLLATLAVSVVLFSGCGLKSGQTIIDVNGTKITRGQFQEIFDAQANNSMFSKMGITINKEKNPFMYYLIQQRVTNDLIINTLIDQELAKRGIKVTQDDVNSEIKGLMEKVGGKAQLNRILKENKISESQFKKDMEKSVKMKRLVAQLGITPTTDAEAKKFYTTHPQQFKYPDRVRASHILISANPNEISEKLKKEFKYKNASDAEINAAVKEEIVKKQAKANEILAEVKKDPTKFAQIAKENSEDTVTAKRGGDLGFFGAKEMVPEFSKAAFAMKPNTVGDKVVQSQYGFHIIMVTDRMAAGKATFEKSKANIKAYLDNQKQVDAMDKLTESLKKQAKITYVDPEFNPATVQNGIQNEVKNGPKKLQAAEQKVAKEKAKKAK